MELPGTAPCPIVIDGRVVWNVTGRRQRRLDDGSATVFPVRHTGLGLTVVHRDVFAKIRKPWFQFGAADGGHVVGEDTWFSNGVVKAGREILCDGAVRCCHFKDGLDLTTFAR